MRRNERTVTVAGTALVLISMQVTILTPPQSRADDLCLTINPAAETIELFLEPRDDTAFKRVKKGEFPNNVCVLETRDGRFKIKWDQGKELWVPSHQFTGELKRYAPPFELQREVAAGSRLGHSAAEETLLPAGPAPALSVADMQRPIDALFIAWRGLDLRGYLDQWAPGATKLDLKSGQRSTLNQLAQDRARLFGQLAGVDTDYAANFKGLRDGIAEFDVSYGMKFRYRSGRQVVEQACESYKVRSEGGRWVIIENQDYKRC
jgi:hypothetical protein